MSWTIEPNSFVRIYDYSKRKGENLDERFFSSIAEPYFEEVRNICTYFSDVIKGKIETLEVSEETLCTLSPSSYEKLSSLEKNNKSEFILRKKDVRSILRHIHQVKNNKIYLRLKEDACALANNGFSWMIDSIPHIIKGKKTYSLNKEDLNSFFVCKVLEQSLKERCRLQMNSRHSIIKQLLGILAMNSPFSIIRTDINCFFESIDTDDLLKKLEETSLPKSQITAIKKLLDTCKDQFDISGVPRGIGISSYLAELYLKEIDTIYKVKPNVVYYNRFVDDIIIVVSESEMGKTISADSIKSSFFTDIEKLKLTLHDGDNKDTLISPKENSICSFEYLGYEFKFDKKRKLSLSISTSKINRYKNKLYSAAWHYWNDKDEDWGKRTKLFVDRIKFLSMRSRLRNCKQNVITGLPSQYRFITTKDLKCLEELDKTLDLICRNMPTLVKNSIGMGKKISFVKGFSSDKYLSFEPKYIKEITSIWKGL